MNLTGGWRLDIDPFVTDPAALQRLTSEAGVLALRGSYKAITLDPRAVILIPNQGQQGACQGHAITTSMEWCYDIQTGKFDIQLSRAAGYYLSQELDNIHGDSGSTINAGVTLATTQGIGEEKFWPYPAGYNNRKPADMAAYTESAKRFVIGNRYNMKTYDGISTFLGSGQGAVEIGISWTSSCDKAVIDSYGGSSGGGHALTFIALSERKDSAGESYVWMANSWGVNWGNKGWAEVSPTAVRQMLVSRYTVMIGISDMPNVKPRAYVLADWQKELRA